MSKISTYIIALVSFLCLSGIVTSQARWEVLSGPNGGEFHSIFCYNDNLYLGNAFHRIVFKSTDAGNSWSKFTAPKNLETSENIVGDISNILADKNGLVYAGKNGAVLVGDTVFSSNKNGLYRHQIGSPYWFYVNHTITDADFTTIDDSGSIYVASEFKIIQLKNFGRSEPTIFYMGPYGSIIRCIQFNTDHTIYFAVDSLFNKSADYGKSWRTTSLGATVYRFIVTPQYGLLASTNKGIFRSTDSGENWLSIGLDEFTVYSTVVDSKGNIYSATGVGLWKCTDVNLKNWTMLPATSMPTNVFAKDSAGILYAGTNYGLRYSTDNGMHWNTIDDNFFQVTALTIDQKKSLYAGSLGIVKYSLPISSSSKYALVSENRLGSAVYGTTELVTTQDNTLFASIYSTVLQSKDDGTSWKISGPIFNDIPFYAYGLTVTDEQQVYAAYGGHGVYFYDSFKDQWMSRYEGIFPKDVYCLLSDKQGRLYCGNFNGLWYSDNKGLSWTMPANDSLNGKFIQKLAKNSRGDLFAATNAGLFKSDNRGLSWKNIGTINTTLGFANSPFLALFPISDDTLFVSGLDGTTYRCIVDRPSSSGIKNKESMPEYYVLNQNYPNPFNPTTKIEFELPLASFTTLKIFDVLGREVSTLLAKVLEPGNYVHTWNATNYPSGVYFYSLQSGNFIETKKLLLQK